MNLKKISTLALASSALMFAACSSDSSSSANRESDDSSSSAAEEASSSSKSKDAEQIAEMMDEMPNMNLGSRYDANLWLTAGKNGFYSLWVIDSKNAETSYGTVAKAADLSTGTLKFTDNDGVVYASDYKQGKDFLAELEKGLTLQFTAKNDSTLMVSINGEDEFEVGKATRKIDKDYLSKADSLVGKTLEWSDKKNSSTYRFYKNGEYVRVSKSDDKDLFEAGNYDVHRQHLLMVPTYHVGSVTRLSNYTLKIGEGEYAFEGSAATQTYIVSSMMVDYPDAELLTKNAWESESNDSLKWTLELGKDSYTIVGKTGLSDNTTKTRRVGEWGVVGDYLILTVDTCQAVKDVLCETERGQLLKLKDSGFEFDNFDSKSEYAAPKKWEAVEEE